MLFHATHNVRVRKKESLINFIFYLKELQPYHHKFIIDLAYLNNIKDVLYMNNIKE